ncbi:hypothetical protein LguiA_035773 [Lonicera macranthoides]
MYRRRGRRSEYPSSVFDAFRPPDDSPLVKGSFSKAAIKMPMTLVFAGCRCLSRDSRGSGQGMKDFDEGTIISVKEIIFLSFLPRSGILIELKEGRMLRLVLLMIKCFSHTSLSLHIVTSAAGKGPIRSLRSFHGRAKKAENPDLLTTFSLRLSLRDEGMDAVERVHGSVVALSPMCTLTLRRVSFLSLRIRKPASLPKIFREKVLVGHHLLTTERIVNERVLALDLVGNSKRSTPFNFKGNS